METFRETKSAFGTTIKHTLGAVAAAGIGMVTGSRLARVIGKNEKASRWITAGGGTAAAVGYVAWAAARHEQEPAGEHPTSEPINVNDAGIGEVLPAEDAADQPVEAESRQPATAAMPEERA